MSLLTSRRGWWSMAVRAPEMPRLGCVLLRSVHDVGCVVALSHSGALADDDGHAELGAVGAGAVRPSRPHRFRCARRAVSPAGHCTARTPHRDHRAGGGADDRHPGLVAADAARGLARQDARATCCWPHRFVDGDVQDQGETWSLLGPLPAGVTRACPMRIGSAVSARTKSFCITSWWRSCSRKSTPRGRAPAGRRAAEISLLEQFQQEWLHHPQPDLYDQSPAALIARERARLPAVVPKGHAHLDDDCPLCRMMADSDQPMIWQLDNYLLEDRFATSFCASRASGSGRARRRLRTGTPPRPTASRTVPAGFRTTGACGRTASRTWPVSADMPAWESVNVMLFAVGGHLAELVHDLRTDAGHRRTGRTAAHPV